LAHVVAWAQDEAELVTELQGGSDAAFDWLVTHYHSPVYSLISGMLGDSADAADVTQEVFLKAYRGIRGFRRGSSLKTWLYRIAIREALNHRRWWWRHRRQQTSIEADTHVNQAPLDLADLGATPFDQLAARELQAVVQQALRAVPKVFRSAVILRDLEGLSYEEVAEVLDVSVGTVKSRILRGRRALRRLLEPLLDDHGAAPVSAVALAGSSRRYAVAPTSLAFGASLYQARAEASFAASAVIRSGRGSVQARSPGGGAK
jgi:RNA polymerase sigma-70 factor (ECF subfamily)